MFLLIDDAVQVQDQVADTQRDPGVLPKSVPPCLFDQAEYLCLYLIEPDPVIVKDIFSFCPDILHQVSVSHGGLHHLVQILSCDPEYKAAVRSLTVADIGPVRRTRRYQDDIPVPERERPARDLDGHIPFQEKIKLIIVMGVAVHP